MDYLGVLFYFLIATIGGIFLFYKRRFGYWRARGFPHTSPSIPWGDLKGASVSRHITQVIVDIYERFPKEKVVGFWAFHDPLLLIRDPEIAKSICVKDFTTFPDRGFNLDLNVEPLMGHLFLISGSKWRNLRIKLSPTFTSGKMKMMFPILEECSKQFAKVLEESAKGEQIVEMQNYTTRFTTDVIASVAFGIDADALSNPNSDFHRIAEEAIKTTSKWRSIKGLVIDSFPAVASLLKFKRLPDEVEDFFVNSLTQTLAYRKANNIKRNDFLDLLIQLMEKGYVDDAVRGSSSTKNPNAADTDKFTFNQLAANSIIFCLAGLETSSTTMQYALYELSKHPEIQDKAREEIKATLSKYNGELSYECVMEMSYVSRVIDETLRFHPPGGLIHRECNKDYTIPNSSLIIPKGVKVIIPTLGLHHDPIHFQDPEVFNPDRFLDEEKSKRHPYSYLPFGEGPRICIGMRFGHLQAKVGLITLLNSFEFDVAADTPIPMVYDPITFILSPKGGMKLKIREVRK